MPYLVDGDLKLPESVAIMTYLAAAYNLPEHWNPPTRPTATGTGTGSSGSQRQLLQRRAVFDAAVNWQHLTIRRGCMTYAFATVIGTSCVKRGR